jgi:CRP-like cAMP-binding protein
MTSTQAAPSLEQVVGLLQKVPIFQGLPTADLERIATLMRGRTAAPGEMIFGEGDPGDRFYIVHSGAVEVVKERPRGDNERLAIKRAGEAFGEMALLTESPRSATVRALEPTNLLYATREQFENLLGGDSLVLRLLRGLARALRALDVRFAARATSGDGTDALRAYTRTARVALEPRSVPAVPGIDFAGGIAASDAAVGQACWDGFVAHDVLFGLVLDVKGARVPAVHLLTLVRGVIRDAARGGELDPARLLARANTAVAEALPPEMDTCVQARIVAASAAGIRIAIAAEQAAHVVKGSHVTELAPHGPPLGIISQFDYPSDAVPAGARVLVVSEAERGLLRGAAELVVSRAEDTAAHTVTLLGTGLERTEPVRAGQDLAFIIMRRD